MSLSIVEMNGIGMAFQTVIAHSDEYRSELDRRLTDWFGFPRGIGALIAEWIVGPRYTHDPTQLEWNEGYVSVSTPPAAAMKRLPITVRAMGVSNWPTAAQLRGLQIHSTEHVASIGELCCRFPGGSAVFDVDTNNRYSMIIDRDHPLVPNHHYLVLCRPLMDRRIDVDWRARYETRRQRERDLDAHMRSMSCVELIRLACKCT